METKVQAPSECERTQNIVVTSDFISALKRAMNWGKAEKLPEGAYYPLYIGEDLLERMNTADNQIVWGRQRYRKDTFIKSFFTND